MVNADLNNVDMMQINSEPNDSSSELLCHVRRNDKEPRDAFECHVCINVVHIRCIIPEQNTCIDCSETDHVKMTNVLNEVENWRGKGNYRIKSSKKKDTDDEKLSETITEQECIACVAGNFSSGGAHVCAICGKPVSDGVRSQQILYKENYNWSRK